VWVWVAINSLSGIQDTLKRFSFEEVKDLVRKLNGKIRRRESAME